MPEKSHAKKTHLFFTQFLLLIGLAGQFGRQQWFNVVITHPALSHHLISRFVAKKFNVAPCPPVISALWQSALFFASIFLGKFIGFTPVSGGGILRAWLPQGFCWESPLSSGLFAEFEMTVFICRLQRQVLWRFLLSCLLWVWALYGKYFEFSMDKLLGTNSKKPMFSDHSVNGHNVLTCCWFWRLVALINFGAGLGYLKKRPGEIFSSKADLGSFIVKKPTVLYQT